jgi:hypothetical protein
MSSVIVQKKGDIVSVIDEIVLQRASTQNACEEFHCRYPFHAAGVIVFGDASGNATQTTGKSDYATIREFFLAHDYRNVRFKVPSSNPSVKERVALMNSRLKAADGESRLFVDPKCKELIQDFEEVAFKPDSSVIDKDRNPKRTHLSDATGYLVWQECRSQPPFGEQGMRLL